MNQQYSLAVSSWDDKELSQIQKVIDSGIFTMGKQVKQYESNFAHIFGSKYAVMVNSGSSANLLMVASLFYRSKNQLKSGDEVIVPAVSWATTYFPLYQYNLKIKFVDIDLDTLNYNLKSLENAITNKTKLIVAVNLLGNSNDFTKIKKIITSSGNNIILIEDNCESMGAEYNGKKTGTIGLMGSFSTFFSHHMSTMEGGVIVTDDEELYQILLSLRSHGWTRPLPEKNLICTKSKNNFYESFRFILPGYNVRPIEMMGAIGLEQLKKLPNFISYRRKNAEFFTEIFANDDRFSIQKEIGKSSWFGFALVIREKRLKRDDVVMKLQQNGIEVRPIVAGNFTKNEVVKYFDYEICGNLDNSDFVDANGFFVGNHHFDIKNEITHLKKTLDSL